MAHFLLASGFFWSERSHCFRLLFFLLMGSVLGALCAKMQGVGFSFSEQEAFRPGVVSVLLRAFLFPCLMVVSYLIGRSFLFDLLFFGKGAFVAYPLCVCCVWNLPQLSSVLPALLFQTLLPLPVQFLCGSVWMAKEPKRRSSWLLLLPMMLFALAGVLVQISLAA